MRLIVVRHGETAYNAERRYTGQKDVPLNSMGRRQAAALGAWLANESFDAIVSSDLERSRATAEAIAVYHGLPVWEDADLREMSLGAWEGQTYAEVAEHDAERYLRWRANPTEYAPPSGETVTQLCDRAARALRRWQDRYQQGNVLWTTHGGFIGVLLCHVLQLDLNRRWQFRHDNASISELSLQGERVVIARVNELAHLRGLGEVVDEVE